MTDLEYGLRHLVAEGIADPSRICAVGWSYGGYAALMSSIQYQGRHRCVVSIAGVTDWDQSLSEARADASFYVGAGDVTLESFIGDDPAVIEEGSPQKPAKELKVPVLLFHGDLDRNVPILHSQRMKKALRKNQVELIEYEGDDHQLRREKNRIDMLTRIGVFLETNLAPEGNAKP